MSVPDTVRHGSNQVIFETHPVLGYNYRMTDIQAAVGREQLRRLPGIVARRREIADIYTSAARRPHSGIGLPQEPAYARSNWQILRRAPAGPLRPERGHAGHARRRHRHAPRHHVLAPRGRLQERPPRAAAALRSAARTARIVLPLYPQMTMTS